MRSLPQRALLVVALGIFSTVAWSLPLTYTTLASGDGIQQNDNNPAVIGASVGTNGGLDHTNVNPAQNNPDPSNPGNDIQDFDSPLYDVSDIRDIVGDFFSVHIDINQTGNVNTPTQFLIEFSMTVFDDGTNTVLREFVFDPANPQAMQVVNQGNGFSDAKLDLFSLLGLDDEDDVLFNAQWSANDGFETFFLHAEENPDPDPDPVIPEPATLTLLGLGLAAGAVARRRRVR